MSELKIFKHESFGQVRVVEKDGEPWFYASDVAKALGYHNPAEAVQKHCKKVNKISHSNLLCPTATPYNIIPQGDVLRLIVRSTLPQAQKIEEWIFEEVVPSVLKHGAYMTPLTLEKSIADPTYAIGLLTALKEEQDARVLAEKKVEEANKTIEEYAPAHKFVEDLKATGDVIYGDEMAKQICKATELKIGQRKFYNWLRQNGFLFKQDRHYPNVITQKGIDAGYIIPNEEVINGRICIVPKFTVKGQMYFIDTFMEMVRNGFAGFDKQGHALYKGEGRAQLSLFSINQG
jgi:anti-repressor protein